MTRTVVGLATALALLAPLQARADFHIHSPYDIDFGEVEIEHNGSASFDRNQDKSGAQSYTIELGTGLTHWWQTEIELGFDRDPGFNQNTLVTQIVSENTFQLTQPGEYFADFGFYVEYGQSLTTGRHAGPNQVTFGPLIAKDIGRTTTTVNLFLTRELGPGQDTQGLDFTWAAQTRWNLWAPLSPAVEIYGDSGVIGSSPRLSQQQLLVGPVGIGSLKFHDVGLGNAGKIKYEIGWLFGATEATAKGTLRWRLEVEIPF
jgi:hypothetical protein